EIDKALKVVEKMRDGGMTPDVYTYMSIIGRLGLVDCLRSKRRSADGSCFVEGHGGEGVWVVYFGLDMLVDSLCDRGSWKKPRTAVSSEMVEKGHKPSNVSFRRIKVAVSDLWRIPILMVKRQDAKVDIISWNAMVAGYGIHGFGKEALLLFQDLQNEGPKPNYGTFICLLSACSHSGLGRLLA
ncbi:hypothetical protein IFM89_030437, partial [Coptis chinensis]